MSLALLRQLKSLTARLTHWHLRGLQRLLLVLVLLIALAALAWQFWLVPRLNTYKPWLEQQMSQRIGAPVRIANLQGGWRGIRPELALQQFQVLNPQGQPALVFSRMEGTLSWWHLLLGQINFRHLHLQTPQLDIVRLQNKHWQIAGITLSGQPSQDGQLLNWLLAQGELTISQGALRLFDQRGEFPPLSANQVQFNVRNWFSNHKVLLKFSPPQLSGSVVELSASLNGSDVNAWADWSGWLKFDLPQADLSRAAAWLLPLLPEVKMHQGMGALGLKLEIAAGKLEGIEADLKLKQWRLSLPTGPELSLPLFDGRIVWRDYAQQRTLQIKAREIDGAVAPLCRNCELQYADIKGTQLLSARNWSLTGLNAYSAFLPQEWAAYREAQLTGTLKHFSIEWPGRWPFAAQAQAPALSALKMELEAQNLGWQNFAKLPAAQGFDVDLQIDPRGGRLKLLGQQARFDYPAQFIEPLLFDRLQSEWQWQRENAGWKVELQGLKVASPDLNLNAEGVYHWPGKGMGQVDLRANIDRLAANRVFAYLPRELGDDVLTWLKTSLLAGKAQKGQIIWRGDVAQFPYTLGTPAAKAGQFTVKTQAAGVTIHYGDDWPMITQVDGQVVIDGMRLTVDANKGDITGTALQKVLVTIPNLEYDQHVIVDGKVSGQTTDFLTFVQNSPVREATQGFLEDLRAQGAGELQLQLDIPIKDFEQTKIKGLYAFEGNLLHFGPTIPVLNQAKGAVSFTESAMKVLPSTAKSLGGMVQMQGETDAKGVLQLALRGQADLAQTLNYYLPPLSPWLKGSVPFTAQLSVAEDDYVLNVASDLQGGQVLLPAPLAKSAIQSRPFRLKVSEEQSVPRVDFAYGKQLQAALLLTSDLADLRGKITLGPETGSVPTLAPQVLDSKGIQIVGQWSQLNVSDWLPLQSLLSTSSPRSAPAAAPTIVVEQLHIDQLSVGAQQLDDVRLSAQINAQAVQASLMSQQIAGRMQWSPSKQTLQAQLSKLWLPLKTASNPRVYRSSKLLSQGPLAEADSKFGVDDWLEWPALNVVVDDFRFKNVELGTLVLSSKTQGRGIDFDELSLKNADGQITLSGLWSKQNAAERTQAQVKIESPNLGKLLKRLGYPEAMKAAPLILHGSGQWQGAPWSPAWETVNGKLDLNIGAGQFSQLEPGVGRFFSILSLQALPRRLKLDFSDIFSTGFEFDQISGVAQIEQGIARTQNLKINGPAAKIRFTGDANFVAGTQHLRVRIVPSISGAVALGVGVVNPLAGLATLAVQSAMDNPLGELLAYEFQIDGSMSDPQIKKIGVKPESPRIN